MSDPSSAAQAASTSGSSEPASAPSPNARRIRGDDGSSSGIGPTSHAPKTFATFQERGRETGAEWERTMYITLSKAQGRQNMGSTLISSAADSPVRTSPSPADEPDSTAPAPVCSSNSPGSQLSFAHDGSWSRTSQGFSP